MKPTTQSPSPIINAERLQAFAAQVVSDVAAANAGFLVNLGRQLGLFTALFNAGPLTSAEVAQRSGCAERYVREWLSTMVASRYIDYLPLTQTFHLAPENAAILADQDSPYHMAPALEITATLWNDEAKLLEAFRSGAGISWNNRNARLYCGVAAFFRNAYKGQLLPHWIPALDGVQAKLEAGIDVADVGCGHGHSTILMAQAFPKSRFFGYDVHAGSIDEARVNALEAGVADRVTFEVGSAKTIERQGFGLICFFDCVHDMGDPVGAAVRAKSCLAQDGSILAVEPFAHDNLEDNINPVGRLYYAGSTTLCCAHSLSEEVGLALGAQAGKRRLSAVFDEAGFSRFECRVETPFNLVLQIRK
jgi:SAM-dependent methyltransferase